MGHAMQDDVLERLETKLAFLEKATNDLSDVVYRQQQDIVALNDKVVSLVSRIDALKPNEPAYTPEEERPPHY
jgi:SlyX protein